MAISERSSGIVLRTRPLTETSLIVHWLTADLGRIATVAKGARRPKSSFRGQIDLFYEAEFSFSRSQRSDLHTLREVKLLQTHAPLRLELGYIEQAAYCAKLIEQTTESETPLPELYAHFSGLLSALPTHPPQPQTVLAFEMKLLEELGLLPDLSDSRLSPGSIHLLQKFIELDWSSLFRVKPSDNQVLEIQQFLHGFLIYNLERIPKGRAHAINATA